MQSLNLQQTVGRSIKDFYEKHDFGDDGGINKKYAWIKFGFFSIPIPNFESRKVNVYLHDVNHIVTEQDTTWKGESAVSAWEVASGGWNNLFIPWLLTLWAMGLGVVFYNKSTLAAFSKGLTMHNSLASGLTKNEIFSMSVAELQKTLSGKPKALKNPLLWSVLSLVVFISPFIIGLFVFLIIIGVL